MVISPTMGSADASTGLGLKGFGTIAKTDVDNYEFIEWLDSLGVTSSALHVHCGAAATVADGGTIAHGHSAAPVIVLVTPSVAAEFVAVTAIGAANFTVGIKTNLGEAGTTQTIYWIAILVAVP
jgi:hypothetical protein